jgi:hypothetical protein
MSDKKFIHPEDFKAWKQDETTQKILKLFRCLVRDDIEELIKFASENKEKAAEKAGRINALRILLDIEAEHINNYFDWNQGEKNVEEEE